ncbi:MAG: hypothetical protein ABJB76_10310 [Candidatus Nitrosocosmicus sp.]
MVESNGDRTSFSFKKYKSYDLKKGIVFGAMGGFVASISFTGLILCMSVLFRYPEGAFLDALGISIIGYNNGIISLGLAALAIILIQGLIIGVIFGIVVSKIKLLNPSNKKKGPILGMVTGIISFTIIYIPIVYISPVYQNLLSKLLSIISSSSFMATRGTEIMNLNLISNHVPMDNMLIWCLISYLVYGFITGGIVTLAYSVYNYDMREIEQITNNK